VVEVTVVTEILKTPHPESRSDNDPRKILNRLSIVASPAGPLNMFIKILWRAVIRQQ
jgi:hypothetical protein